MEETIPMGFVKFRLFSASLSSLVALIGCDATMPSERMHQQVHLPVPTAAETAPSPERLDTTDRGERLRLSPLSLIKIAFDSEPEIKSTYQRFRSEEARYDFFYVSRDSLTPQLSVSNRVGESRGDELVTRDRDHTVELSVEKLFFDTTELRAGVGYRTDATNGAIGNHPFLSANLRYPLWASRERLERSSEDIFRRNELDDAQLGYIQTVRRRLLDALFKFYNVTFITRLNRRFTQWRDDLRALRTRVEEIVGRDVADDVRRVEAEIASISAEVRNSAGRQEVELARLKSRCGIPFHVTIELVDAPFNPFEGVSHEEMLRKSIDSDPEIATLRNSRRNAEVQLDLARRGQWDIALLLDAESSLEGRGKDEGESDWSVLVGFEVSAVDARVTSSLIRQAQARIARFTQAIASRENRIFVDTLEPYVRIKTLGASRQQLIDNLPRYEADYRTGLKEYVAGRLNI
ncbi:MAG: TolC family protein, partial [Gemmatimonadetes bacterium]|nr:TolC family protein [Gemmatimonadota bacterium]